MGLHLYAAAHALAARCYQFQQMMGWVRPREPSLERGIEHARRAAETGSNDPDALWMAGLALIHLNGDCGYGKTLIDRSLTLNPNSANAWTASSLANTYRGERDLAIDHFYRAWRLNPLDTLHHVHWNALSMAYFSGGLYHDADKAADKTLNLLPTYPPGLRLKISICGQMHQIDEAANYVKRLIAVDPMCCTESMSEMWGLFIDDKNLLTKLVEGLRIGGLPDRPRDGLTYKCGIVA